MSVKALMATILQNELTSRCVNSLTLSNYEAIVEQLLEQPNGISLVHGWRKYGFGPHRTLPTDCAAICLPFDHPVRLITAATQGQMLTPFAS